MNKTEFRLRNKVSGAKFKCIISYFKTKHMKCINKFIHEIQLPSILKDKSFITHLRR